ncbi:MAG: hypothetical protein ABGZ17_27270, partial [Planctomycetaceae bacterium]
MRWIPVLLGLMVFLGCSGNETAGPDQSSGSIIAQDAKSQATRPTGDNSPIGQAEDTGARQSGSSDTESGDGANQPQDVATAKKLIGQAELHIRRGRPGPAIESLSQAIGIDPENSRAYAMRASVYVAWGENANALADFSAAIRLSPRDARLHNARGFFFMARRQLDRAEKDFDQAIRLDVTF